MPAVLLAQQSDESAPQAESGMTETIDVKILRFSLLARTERGEPITDLKPEDLRVKLGGKQVPIAFLEPALTPDLTTSDLPHVKLRLELGSVAENTIAEPRVPNYYIFLIDGKPRLSSGPVSEVEALKQFIFDKVGPQDLAAVMSYGKSLRVEASFTSNRQALADAVVNAYQNKRPVDVAPVTQMEKMILDLENCIIDNDDTDAFVPGDRDPVLAGAGNNEPDAGCVQHMASFYVTQFEPEIRSYVQALAATVDLSRGVNGETTVFAVSHGVPVDPLSSFAEAARAVFGRTGTLDLIINSMPEAMDGANLARETLSLARREKVTFHFLDPTSPPAGVRSARLKGVLQAGVRPMQIAHENGQGLPRMIARETGGVFLETRNVRDGLENTFELQRGRYTVGIDAKYFDEPGKEEKLKIRSRRKGILIDHSRGLVMEGSADLQIAGRIALPQTESATKIPFAIGIDASDLAYADIDEGKRSDLTLHVVVQMMDGRHLVGLFHNLSHSLSGDAEAPSVVAVRGTLEAPPGTYRVVAHVRNRGSDRKGTFFREVVIPEQNAENR